MSDIVDRIAAVLREHREEIHEEDVCICGWRWTPERDYPAHVAERIVAELGMTAVRCADERWWSTRIERGFY